MGWTVKLCWRGNVVDCTIEFVCGSEVGIGVEVTWVVAFAVDFVCSSEGFCTALVVAVGWTVKLCWRGNVVDCTIEFVCGSEVGIGVEVTWVVAFAVDFVCSSEGFCTALVVAVGWTVKLCWRGNVVDCTIEFVCGSKVGIGVEFTWSTVCVDCTLKLFWGSKVKNIDSLLWPELFCFADTAVDFPGSSVDLDDEIVLYSVSFWGEVWWNSSNK